MKPEELPEGLTPVQLADVGGGDDPTLVDVLDRVLERGVVIVGDVVLSVADVDLMHLSLRLTLTGIVDAPRQP